MLNQQDLGHFNATDASDSVTLINGVCVRRVGSNPNLPCPQPGDRGVVTVVPGTISVAATAGGAPLGFNPSSDPHGFGFQFFAGHRKSREPSILPNQPPVINSFSASTAVITLPCPEG